MAENEYVNKVVYDGSTLIDLTADTVTAETLLEGYTAHDASGALITGIASEGVEPPIWQDSDGYVHVSDTATAPCEIYTDDDFVFLDVAVDLQAKTASYTPTESVQTDTIAADSSYDGLSQVSITVGAIASDYVGSAITRRSSTDLTASGATVSVPSGYYSSSASKAVSSGSATAPATISGTSATVSTGTNTLTLSKTVSVTPSVTAGYVSAGTAGNSSVSLTASVNTRSSSDLTVSGATVTAPAGYYSSQATKTVASGSATTPATTVTANPSISVGSDGLITATASATKSVTPTVSAGYVSSGTAGTITVNGSNTSQLSTQSGTTISPTESEQTAVAAGKYTTGAVKVGAISNTYVGSGITQRSSSDLTASGANVSVPAGYYASAASKSVASGSVGTPSASKGTVSDHSVSVTPKVTSTDGYIIGGTKFGTAVTVSASELVSGTKSISENGTAIDVTNYASVDVDVEPGLQQKSATPSESAQTVTPDSGYYGLSSVSVGAISSSYVGSGITRRSSTDLTSSNLTVTAPAGYYASAASKTLSDASLVSGNIKSGATIFGVSGAANVVDTTISSDAASSSYIASGKKAYVNGSLVTGNVILPTVSQDSQTKVLTIS